MSFDTDYNLKHVQVKSLYTNKIYSSKLEVLNSNELSQNLIKITHNDAWEQFDWTVEPSETFDELLVERCNQLRQKYSYLTLYFSGGADSETMVQAFIKAKVDPDEIVINNIIIAKDNPLKDIDLAIQKLKVYQTLLPKTKITINNLERDFLIKFLHHKEIFSSSFNGSIGNYRRLTNNVLQELGYYGKNLNIPSSGHIFAELKPSLYCDNTGYYVCFTHTISASQYADWFFTTLDLPKLHIKQSHLVKNYLKSNYPSILGNISDSSIYRNKIIEACRYKFDGRFQPDKFKGLGEDIINLNNYQTEDSLVYRAMKEKDPELYDMYNSKVLEILSAMNKSLYNKETLDISALKSKKYFLGVVN
jgi:hypothetical protein